MRLDRLASRTGLFVAGLALASLMLRPMNRMLDAIRIPSGAVPAHGGASPSRMADGVIVGDRNLAVDIWYPSDGRPKSYDEVGPYPLPPRAPLASPIAHILARLGIIEEAPPLTSPTKLPLLVLTPGWNGDRRSNMVLSAALASAGYVVAAIDDVGADPDVSGETGHDFDFSSEAGFANSWSAAERRLILMTDRITGVVTGLLARSENVAGWRLAGRLDPNAVGVLGYSFGGTAAAEVPRADKRIRAAANLDGWLMGHAAHEGVAAPYLSFSSEFPDLENAANSWSPGRRLMATATMEDRRILSRLSKSADTFALIVKGTQHSDFSDDLFTPALRTYVRPPWGLWREGQLRIHALTVSFLLAFFDKYLRHLETSNLLTERPCRNPEVIWIGPP